MPDPISFPSTTANLKLPLLFSGQAQREYTINQAYGVIDALLLRTVESTLDTPPSDSLEGQCFIVGANATGAWQGHQDEIAVRIGDAWHFIVPQPGIELFDRATGSKTYYTTGWQEVDAASVPAGGSVIDTEARASIEALVNSLIAIGVLSNSD